MSALRTVLLALTLLPGCSGGGGEDPTPSSAAAPAASGAAAVTRSTLSVASGTGQAWGTLKPKDAGYKVKGGTFDGGKVKVGDDRVKLKDASGATLAKVKRKDSGFKIYRGDEDVVAKAKHKGAGFKLSDPDGAAWGEVSPDGGTLGGQPVAVETAGDKLVVKRGGEVVGEVEASVGAKAAVMLAVTELAMEQRVAAMIFVQEKLP